MKCPICGENKKLIPVVKIVGKTEYKLGDFCKECAINKTLVSSGRSCDKNVENENESQVYKGKWQKSKTEHND